MNEKEARDIILKETTGDHMCRADGYLEALDKAKGLEGFVNHVINYSNDPPIVSGAKEALAKYRSEK